MDIIHESECYQVLAAGRTSAGLDCILESCVVRGFIERTPTSSKFNIIGFFSKVHPTSRREIVVWTLDGTLGPSKMSAANSENIKGSAKKKKKRGFGEGQKSK